MEAGVSDPVSIGPPLYAAVAVPSSQLSAIVGSNPNPGEAVLLPATNYLRPDALGQGEAGDFSNLDEFTIETWMRIGSTPAGTQAIFYGPDTGGSNLQYRLDLSSARILTWTVRNSINVNIPTAASTALVVDTWHHVVCQTYNSAARLWIDGVQQPTSAWVAMVADPAVAGGTFTVGDGAGTVTMAFDEMAMYRHGLTPDRIAAHYAAGVSRGFARGQAAGQRITAVLDAAGSQAATSIQAGTRTVEGMFMVGQAPLDEIRRAVRADNVDAVFFAGRDGTLTYLNAGHRSASPYNTVQATFDDDGTDLPYQGLTLDYSDSLLANQWDVTRTGGETQTVTDTASIAAYYKRPQSISDVPVTTDGEASAIATAMLAKYKDPMTRITEITLMTDDPAVTEAVFRRDIGDRIRVFRTPPGGGARIDQTLFIQKISVDASPSGPWRVTWAVSPV